MNQIKISKLESIQDVYDLVQQNFLKERESIEHSSEEFELIIDDVGLGIVNMTALTMLTCLLYSIRKKFQYPFKARFESHKEENFHADRKKSAFIQSVGFIEITQLLRIINWNIPKIIPKMEFNPHSGIHQVDIPIISKTVRTMYSESEYYKKDIFLLNIIKERLKDSTQEEIDLSYEEAKKAIKNEIKEEIDDLIEDIFKDSSFGKSLKYNIVSYVSEILLNSFIHGRTKPFFAVQRTNKKISISICDDGLGLENTFANLHNQKLGGKQAIIQACEHRKNDSYGIYDIIRSVIGIDKPTFVLSDAHHGFFTISDGPYILNITRNNYAKLHDRTIDQSIFDTKMRIRGLRVSMDILIR